MKIFEKYFLISIFKSSAVSLVSLVLIFAVLQFIDELGDINKNGYALEEIARYVLFLFPSYFNALFVLAIMIGTVFAIGELNSNKEILIFQTASISIGQIIRKSYKYPFIIAVFCLIVFEIIAPVSWKIADQIKKNAFGEVSDFSTSSSWVKEKNKFFNRLENSESILMYEFNENNNLVKFEINSLSPEGYNVDSLEVNQSDNFYQPLKNNYSSSVPYIFFNQKFENTGKNLEAFNLLELVNMVIQSYENQTNSKEYTLEVISRVIKPITLIAMIMVAIPFIMNFQRNTSLSSRIFLTISIGVIAHLLTKIVSAVATTNSLLAYAGSLMPTLLLGIVGYSFIKIKFN